MNASEDANMTFVNLKGNIGQTRRKELLSLTESYLDFNGWK